MQEQQDESAPFPYHLKDDDLWEADHFSASISASDLSVYGSDVFSSLSLSQLFILGTEHGNRRLIAERGGSGYSGLVVEVIEAAFKRINNKDVIEAFRRTLSGAFDHFQGVHELHITRTL